MGLFRKECTVCGQRYLRSELENGTCRSCASAQRDSSIPPTNEGAADKVESSAASTPNDNPVAEYAPTPKHTPLQIANDAVEQATGPHPDISPYLHFEHGAVSSDPSIIRTDLPVANGASVEKLPYYPSYTGMAPEQRWVYLHFLADPYAPIEDIGYVFVLYYGLECWLSTPLYRDVARVILKLRTAHENGSFYFYSAQALLGACLKHNDFDLFAEIASVRGFAGLSDVTQLYLLKLCGLPITPEFIISTHSSWGFTNNRYMRMYPDRFLYTLRCAIEDRMGSESIELDSYGGTTTAACRVAFAANYAATPASGKCLSQIFSKTLHYVR